MKTNKQRFTKMMFLLSVLFFTSCNQQDHVYDEESLGMGSRTESIALENAASESSDQTNVVDVDVSTRKLIKNGDITFETNDIDSTRGEIINLVKNYQGYVSLDRAYKYTGKNGNTLVVRIPASNFDQFLIDATQNVKELDGRNINIEDVTEEFLDIQARIKTKKELEHRYLNLLQKANKVSEILEIEKELGALRTEIESIEGRLKYLTDQVSMSTLSITFYEVVPVKNSFGEDFRNGFANGWENLIWFFVALTNIWPFILIFLGFIGTLILYIKRKNTKIKKN